SGDMEQTGLLENKHAGQYVALDVIYNSTVIKEVAMIVIIGRDTSENNKDLVYISRLLEKIAPYLQNRDQIIKQGVSEALKKNWAIINVGGKELSFSY